MTSPAQARSILLIDDSPFYREALSRALERAGYETLQASDGDQGLKLAQQHRPAAIVIDVVLPGLDGPSVVRRIRLDPEIRKTPCLLLTGNQTPGAEAQALDSGADAFARKSQDLEVIVARIAALVRSSTRLPDRQLTPVAASKRLLVVDDDELWLDSMVEILRTDGYEVYSARNGESALTKLKSSLVDGILLDLMMPGIGGMETCRRIKETPNLREIPLIILTSLEDRETMIEALADGADDFVLKTSDPDLLRARVRAQLRRKQFEDENRRIIAESAERDMQSLATRAAQQLANARAELLEDLQRKNKELEAFGYSVSHDLRAPLRAIEGFSRALEEDYAAQLDAQGRDHLARVRAAARRMSELLDDLLRLSRIGRTELRRDVNDLSALAKSVAAAAVERTVGDQQVEIAVEENMSADCDPRMMRLVFENLINNALKFSSKVPEARVELGSKKENDEAVFFVRDNGVGFDMAYAGKLFAPFQRLHAEADFPGTGVGLATVYRIIDRHGGRIWADSAPGKGATFFFTLPPRR